MPDLMADRRLLDAAGNPIVVADLPDQDTTVIAVAETPVIPTTVHGFSVDVKGMGPYPIDAPKSHRKAMYVELIPISPEARSLCDAKNAERIHANTPLGPELAAIIAAEPNGKAAEEAVLVTLRAAVKLLRKYLAIPRQSFESRRN